MSEASAGKRPGRCVPCKPESAHRVERRESPSKGRAASPGQCPQFHRDNDNDNDKDKKTITKKTKTKTLILRSGESPSKGRAASPGQCPQCLLPTTLTTPS